MLFRNVRSIPDPPLHWGFFFFLDQGLKLSRFLLLLMALSLEI